MKFNCGLTRQQKRIKRWSSIDIEKIRKGNKWFAWYPVRVEDDSCRWLEFVNKSYPESYRRNLTDYLEFYYWDDEPVSYGLPVFRSIS